MVEKKGRGRPVGSKNKPKNGDASEAPSADGSVGHDHNQATQEGLTDEQRQGLFFKHCKEYNLGLEEKKRADAAFKNVCKIIKGEGGSVAEIKLALMEPAKFEAHVREEAEMMQRVARWLNSPVGTQFEIFEQPDRVPADDRAYADGKIAGLKGESGHPPYAAGLSQGQRWMDGYHEGQKTLAAGFKPLHQGDDEWGKFEQADQEEAAA